MKAVIQTQYGPPSMLRVEEIDRPDPKDGELLIKVHAATANRTDCGFIRGKPLIIRCFSGLTKPKFRIPGSEFAGEVIAVGAGVNDFVIGDRVVGFKDDDYGLGCLAEFTTMPAEGMVAKIPDCFDFNQAAPMAEGAHYALNYIRAANIESGQDVLVNGATGAIGSAAVQLLKALNGKVFAVCGTENLELVRSLGADHVIDYQNEDFTKLDERFDVVFDAVGKSTYGRTRHLLKPNGIYMSTEFGPWCQNPLLALRSKCFGKQKVLFPIPTNLKTDLEYLCRQADEGKFKPVIDRVYPIEEVVAAFEFVETGMKVGNVVIQVSSD